MITHRTNRNAIMFHNLNFFVYFNALLSIRFKIVMFLYVYILLLVKRFGGFIRQSLSSRFNASVTKF